MNSDKIVQFQIIYKQMAPKKDTKASGSGKDKGGKGAKGGDAQEKGDSLLFYELLHNAGYRRRGADLKFIPCNQQVRAEKRKKAVLRLKCVTFYARNKAKYLKRLRN